MPSENYSFVDFRRSDEQNPIEDFQVFGERRSGTNYIAELIQRGSGLRQTHLYGWKHAFPTMPAISPRSLIIVAVRDPVDWLVSLHKQPYDSFTERGIGFSDFIRTPWRGKYGPRSIGAAKWGLSGYRVVRGVVNQQELHPVSGKVFRNPMAMRNCKLAAHLGFLSRHDNVAITRYESVLSNPEGFLRLLAMNFDLDTLGLNSDIDHAGPRAVRSGSDKIGELADDDVAYILSELDSHQEKYCGYDRYFQAGD